MHRLKKSMILLIACTFILMSASCAFASDLNHTCNLEDAENHGMNLDVENKFFNANAFESDMLEISQFNSDNTANVTGNLLETESIPDVIPTTYNDLYKDIENLKPGDIYDIKKDYTIEDCGSDLSKNRIININADNVVINGNGHTINANGNRGYFAVFNVNGDNVTIMNLNIINARIYNYDYSKSYWNAYGDDYAKVLSPIEWHGDNGVMSNCVFDNNIGEEGGAIYWAGNNGLIDSCYFNNNGATICGGSIFICGYENTISNSIIKDSSSNYNDGVFLKNFDENGELMELHMNNCTFENSLEYINDFHVEGSCAIIRDNKQIYPVIPAGSYNELREIIRTLKDGDVYTLTKDYYFDYACYYYPIMANNVTINGNGHKIYGSDPILNPLIWVMADNVRVINLTFDFKDLDIYSGASFVNWIGNNGTIENCTFIGNHAPYGGAISWKGNNGVIDNCAFINNTGHVAAGAIFISGENNIIANSLFLNCYSMLTGEAIFIDYKRKNLTIENVFFDDQNTPLIDEGKTIYNIDINELTDKQYVYISNEPIIINELIYMSIMKGGINNLNEEISYYSSYDNKSCVFIFTITKDFKQYDITYTQDYYFKNISNNTFNNIFSKLKNNDYEIKFTVTKTEYISSESEYKTLIKDFYLDLFAPIYDYLTKDENNIKNGMAIDFTRAMNVVFTKALTIDCEDTLDLNKSIFDTLSINGAESTIKGSSEDRDEYKWVVLSENNVLAARNITLKGFNTVIENMGGQCIFEHVNFNENKMDYIIERDWGAAILNTGMITCINCSFTNNYAKNGGAIFNQGLLTILDCIFSSNEGYGEGDDICVGDGGEVIFDNVMITSNDQSGHVHIAESMSLTESTLITVFSVAASFMIGTAVGFLTANPVAGAIVGGLIGSAIGSASAAWIISENFDVNYDRLKTALTLIIGCGAAGAIGGGFAGYVRAEMIADAAWVEAAGGPGNAMVHYGYTWYHIAAGEVITGGLMGGIVGITHYFTN